MNTQQIKVIRKSQKDIAKPLIEKTKILKEINRIAGKQGAAIANLPTHRVVIRRSLPNFKEEQTNRESVSRSKAFRSQASQTTLGGPSDYEGIIRYPSSRRVEAKPRREVGLQVSNAQTTPRECGGDIGSIMELASNCHPPVVDHVKLHQAPHIKPKLTPVKMKPDPTRAPPTYQRGVLPKYLRKMKEHGLMEKLAVRRRNSDITGTSVDNDTDAKERLEKLKKIAQWHDNYNSMVSELNMLGIAS